MKNVRKISLMGSIFLFVSLAVALDAFADNSQQVSEQPNIVLILADDMSYDSVSAFNPKMGELKTPNIDRLVQQGMNFTDAHSGSSVCTPTRYGLLTGRYCWRSRLKHSVLWEWAAPLIEPGRLTVAELLQQQGYRTGIVGKWHLGMNWYDKSGNIANGDLQLADSYFKRGAAAERIKAVEKRIDLTRPVTGGPADNGFGYYFGVDVPNFPPYVWIQNDQLQGVPSVAKPKKMFGHPGPMLPGWKLDAILPTLADKSVEWIHARSKGDSPFFLYLPLTSPHTPIVPSPGFKGKSGISGYADFVIETDWVVGQVMRALRETGTANNTIVIFSTDNGAASKANFKNLESHGIDLHHHYRGHKLQIYEGGHRVPFIVRWPARAKAGSTCRETICLNDFMATVADLLDVELPDGAAEDSTSILPLITGGVTELPEHPMVVNHDFKGGFAIRNGSWKLIATSPPQLYDLKSDPKEANNVAALHPETVATMSARLKKYQSEGHSVVRQ